MFMKTIDFEIWHERNGYHINYQGNCKYKSCSMHKLVYMLGSINTINKLNEI